MYDVFELEYLVVKWNVVEQLMLQAGYILKDIVGLSIIRRGSQFLLR